jgi:hypothetical protein
LTVDGLMSLKVICDDTYSMNPASGDESDGKGDVQLVGMEVDSGLSDSIYGWSHDYTDVTFELRLKNGLEWHII